jgi:hypothetical protein
MNKRPENERLYSRAETNHTRKDPIKGQSDNAFQLQTINYKINKIIINLINEE